jgi:protein-S-isoprenylcysteine O-methyltransferase Ste14
MRDLLVVYLPVYFLLFFGFAFLWRSWKTYKLTGINPYALMNNPGAEKITNRYFRILPFLSLAVMVVYLLGEEYYLLLAPITWLEWPLLQWLGLALMTIALVLILVSQGQMGKSWRIGVDYENPTEFVQAGMFRYSRNPIFLGIVLSVAGLFLLLPNALTLLIMMLDLALIQVQIRLEEQYLASAHGDVYEEYCSKVRRWI